MAYCTPDQAETLNAEFPHRVRKDENIYAALTSLDDSGSSTLGLQDSYPILVATQPEYMRAVDYRAPIRGLDLFIGTGFSNNRHVVQALGRVGRNGDPCERMHLDSLPRTLLDSQRALEHTTNLIASSRKLSSKKQKRSA